MIVGSSAVKVSVCVITYNHERYIAQAIEGILAQEVDFTYEVVVGEDCSSDNTRRVLQRYVDKYRDRITLLSRPRNLGMMENFISTVASCRGEYVALCEGDDYWTWPWKLRTQVEFLDAHSDYAIASHNVVVRSENQIRADREWPGAAQKSVLSLRDLLRGGSGGATCSLVFRNRVFGDFPEWYGRSPGGDWALQVLCAERGRYRYFPDVMAVYRVHEHGARHAQALKAHARGDEVIALSSRNSMEVCDLLDRHLKYTYSGDIRVQRAFWSWLAGIDYAKAGRRRTAWSFFRNAAPYVCSTGGKTTFVDVLRGCAWMLLPMKAAHLARSWRATRWR